MRWGQQQWSLADRIWDNYIWKNLKDWKRLSHLDAKIARSIHSREDPVWTILDFDEELTIPKIHQVVLASSSSSGRLHSQRHFLQLRRPQRSEESTRKKRRFNVDKWFIYIYMMYDIYIYHIYIHNIKTYTYTYIYIYICICDIWYLGPLCIIVYMFCFYYCYYWQCFCLTIILFMFML